MGVFAPALMSAAAGYGVNKVGQAVFGPDMYNSAQPVGPGGPGGAPSQNQAASVSLLGGLQQQMQQEEAMRQQAIKQLLMQFTQGMAPPQGPQQPIQMES